MGSIITEFLKLKRSTSWVVVIGLPVLMVFLGGMSTIAGEGSFDDGWHTLWVRSVGLYGMAILSVGIAILASLVWRVEHKSSNWNALMSRSVPTSQIIAGKVAAISVLCAAMQIVLVATVVVLGKVLFELPGLLPANYLASSALIVVACVPVAAIQSAFSTFFRSFAAPVAIALVVTGACTMALLMKLQTAVILPYALLTWTTQIGAESMLSGGGTSFAAVELTLSSASLTVLLSAALTVAIVALTSAMLNRTDTRA